ncbi:type I secretion system permease/ATPase [Amphritea opalescens]|uniref:Type I secretion system permease/ATPase n=1 Tax=Amphritea opalescens TaxID=2490544 RepID=A0A430KRY6_9GAMM|nr:type I secretion system permease/ATPase [Amphritea opalescens]RTE66262.1 type I secretion system permease/ATPase [Amphritea opalescens]
MDTNKVSESQGSPGTARRFAFKKVKQDKLRQSLVRYSALFGRSTTESELADGFPLEEGRLPIEHISRALKRVGLSAKVTAMDLNDLSEIHFPVILITHDHDGLILLELKQAMATVLENESGGKVELSIDQLEALYSGVLIIGKPEYVADNRAENFAQAKQKHWLKDSLKACWPTYLEVGAASLVANCLTVATSLFALQVYDRVVPNDAFDTLFVLASGVVLAIVLDFVLRLLRTHLLDMTGKKLDLELSSALFNRVLQIRLSAKPRSTGAFSSQLREFESVREFFTSSTASTISDFPFIFLFLLLIGYLGGPIVWVPLVAIVLMLLPSLLMQGKLAALSRENIREGAVKYGLMLEVIENLESVKAIKAEGRNLRLWDNLSNKLASDNIKLRRLSSFLNQGASMVQQLCYVAVVVVGVYLISSGELTIGGLIACTMLASRTIAPVNQMTGVLVRWQHVKVALEGLNDLMKAPIERPLGRQFARKETLVGDYQLEGVKLHYNPDAPPALNIAKLNITAGSRVILLGSNGAGKSTLLRVLSGLEDIQEGTFLLDHIAMSQLDPADRQKNIGYLPQDVALFHGSLRDNLLLSGNIYDDDVLYEVLDAIGLGVAVRAHPQGLDLPILSNRSLSGGQRQAVGLARLILQDPKIVLLDEPTAAFDQSTEENVIRFLQTWLKGRTLIMATHKRKMLVLGDRGIVLANGKIHMDGTFEDLMKQQVVNKAS